MILIIITAGGHLEGRWCNNEKGTEAYTWIWGREWGEGYWVIIVYGPEVLIDLRFPEHWNLIGTTTGSHRSIPGRTPSISDPRCLLLSLNMWVLFQWRIFLVGECWYGRCWSSHKNNAASEHLFQTMTRQHVSAWTFSSRMMTVLIWKHPEQQASVSSQYLKSRASVQSPFFFLPIFSRSGKRYVASSSTKGHVTLPYRCHGDSLGFRCWVCVLIYK